jgi:diguanylate cyclase (GGDEF)-like protein
MDIENLNRAYRAVNSELARQNKTLAAREQELEDRNRHFDAALSNMAQGLCMFDSELRVVACNDRYRMLFSTPGYIARPGVSLREMIEYNVKAGRHPGETVEEVMAARCEIFAAGKPAILRSRIDGERTIEMSYRPIDGGDWVVTYDDITERESAKEQVAEQNRRFDAALNNMPHGLCMFRSDKTLIVCNEKYAQMYQLPPALRSAGTSLDSIIAHRIATGQGPCDTQFYWNEHVKRAREGKFSSYKLLLTDGRTIQIDHQPLAGGGWVATHQDVTEAIRVAAQIDHMARHDGLTGLANRVHFRNALEESLKRAARGDTLAVLCLDLDHFKTVNDTLGHLIGDDLLKSVAQRLEDCIRDTDIVARLGGDEFAIVQNGGAQPHGATILASRVIDALSRPYTIGDHVVTIGVSVGIALAPADGTSAEELLKNADLALYRSKEDGRGLYRFFETEMDARMQARRSLELDLREALAKGELRLEYQPLISVERGRVIGFEALLRWDHPRRGVVPPVEFIGVAEEIGLIQPIGAWVLREACAEAAKWPADIRIAVNLSPVQFRNATLVLDVVTALAASGLAAERLELEITETAMLNDTESTLTTLRQLKALGISISMDDFGTGYSSLAYLRKFPFDKIKIDQSFIRSLSDEHESVAIIKAITGLGTSLGMTTTAEGVETAEQLRRLSQEGCDEVQGYLFSKAVPPGQIADICIEVERSFGTKGRPADAPARVAWGSMRARAS